MTRIKVLSLLFFLIGVSYTSSAQMTRAQYIEKYKDIAIQNMREHKVPASITLAQALLESGNGNSELAKKSNNHFGIKCHSSWKGKKTYHDDDKKQECFRVYKTVYDSYADHSDFLHKPRYAKCFELKITDYKGWAKELKNAGYATNPKYPKLLIKIIEDNQLYQYDKEALSGGKKGKNKTKTPVIILPAQNSNDTLADIDYYGKPQVRLSENKIKYIQAEKGDTPQAIAKKLGMGIWQIKVYNNVEGGYHFQEGDRVYLQPKKSKSSKKYHIAKQEESLWTISQLYGVKISKLRKYNSLSKGASIKPGQKVYLQRHP